MCRLCVTASFWNTNYRTHIHIYPHTYNTMGMHVYNHLHSTHFLMWGTQWKDRCFYMIALCTIWVPWLKPKPFHHHQCKKPLANENSKDNTKNYDDAKNVLVRNFDCNSTLFNIYNNTYEATNVHSCNMLQWLLYFEKLTYIKCAVLYN